MKILVVSDTHGDSSVLEKVVGKHNNIKTVIHLGDGEEDVAKLKEKFSDKNIYNVCGNCDLEARSPETIEIEVENQKILATHGHLFKVKKNLEKLLNEAKQRGANIVLYGHTHTSRTDFKDGIYIMNPGSLHDYVGSYGVLNIEDGKVLMEIFDI